MDQQANQPVSSSKWKTKC